MLNSSGLRLKIGACIYDMPSFAWHMFPGRERQWTFFCNRDERLLFDERRIGAQCDWRWTSDLHIAKVFPRLGLRLLKRSLRDWPIKLKSETPQDRDGVQVSFIIGHRGKERLPQLLTTLKSIAAQRGCICECIVVEQSEAPEVCSSLPGWVRYIHTPLPDPNFPYSRSWAFNVGARAARGTLLVLHDNDILVPEHYARELMARFEEGYEVINLKRFIFYLSEAHSRRVWGSGDLGLSDAPESVMQNAQGGGSLGVSHEAYFATGGFDESFVGWGGEDNEFWERAQTRVVWPYGYLPVVHLWHESQFGKFNQARDTAELYESRSAIPVEERIKELRKRNPLSMHAG
jgi:GT2 family glycosyltransferase